MVNINKYFASFYGDLTNIREDVASLSEMNPRCIESSGILMISFTTALTIGEVKDYLSLGDRLFILQKLDENLSLNMGTQINEHFLNLSITLEEYGNEIPKPNLIVLPLDNLSSIDSETKDEIIDKLLERYPNISEEEKLVLKKLTESNNE